MIFSYPTDEKRITSPFGQRGSEFHNGIDLGVPVGTEVKAAGPGIVLKTYSDSLGGNQMIVKHVNGYTTGYAHLSAFRKGPGDEVSRGETIALSGATGQVTGPHLHFTVTNKQGEKVDPERVLKANWVQWIPAGAGILLLIVLIILFIRKFRIKK